MKLPVFQHIDCVHPGSLRKCLKADGIQWDAVAHFESTFHWFDIGV